MTVTIEAPMEREIKLANQVVTIQPTARVERLRQKYLNTKDRIVLDIIRSKTRIMKETLGQPMAIRQAKAFAAAVKEMTINIYPDELFVGWLFCEPRGSNLPWGQALAIEGELDTIASRKVNSFQLSDEDKVELREEIIPYWKEHRDGGSTLPHWTAGYEKVLKIGLIGIQNQAEERIARLDLTDPDEFKKQAFLQGVLLALEAALEIGGKFAAKARELADAETNPVRKSELQKIAETCDQVPAQPARTFYEAIQSIWFIHILHAIDNDHASGMGPGRADQYLYPFYKRDIEEGRMTKDEAQEMIDCWFMRYSQYFVVWSEYAGSYGTHTPHTPGHHLDIGGLKPDGRDAANELSYMFIEAMMHTPGMTEPTLGLLVHSKTPEELLIKACQLTAIGGGYPMFINQDHRIECMLARNEIMDGPPISLSLARQATGAGCHELVLPDMESGFSFDFVLLAGAVDLMLTNGVSRTNGKRLGVETGDPRQFKTFEDVKDAFQKQVISLVRDALINSHAAERQLVPKAFNSALVDDCIEKGISKEEGGARYNISGVQTWGRIDAGDSLAAIKKLVFDDQKISMGQLCDALDNNYAGFEDIRKMCLEAPKFGNDDDDADEQVAWVSHIVNQEAKKHKSTYGGCKVVTEVPSASYLAFGKVVGALPSGRLSGEPLGEAASPTVGSAVNGPTSILMSAGKVNYADLNMGTSLNMRLDPSIFDTNQGIKRMADLVRVFVDQRVDHMQINVVYTDTLRAAQREPELYKDLTVKVAGYNARFVDLHEDLQETIIARTEHGF